MERKEIEVFSELSNFAIVRMPGRNFPGSVIQGDSLSILLKHAERVHQMAIGTGSLELIDEAALLRELLAERLEYYEKVITASGFSLPYFRQRTI